METAYAYFIDALEQPITDDNITEKICEIADAYVALMNITECKYAYEAAVLTSDAIYRHTLPFATKYNTTNVTINYDQFSIINAWKRIAKNKSIKRCNNLRLLVNNVLSILGEIFYVINNSQYDSEMLLRVYNPRYNFEAFADSVLKTTIVTRQHRSYDMLIGTMISTSQKIDNMKKIHMSFWTDYFLKQYLSNNKISELFATNDIMKYNYDELLAFPYYKMSHVNTYNEIAIINKYIFDRIAEKTGYDVMTSNMDNDVHCAYYNKNTELVKYHIGLYGDYAGTM